MFPYSNNLQNAKNSFNNGNFGLYFNKLVEINENDNFKKFIDDEKSHITGHETRLLDIYNKIDKVKINSLLSKKQKYQKAFCDYFKSFGFEYIEYNVKLKSNLITGIGQTNPDEVGMVFDHTIGIPYIPSSSIKGLVRFSHNLLLLENKIIPDENIKKGYFDDEEEWTKNPDLFGTQKKRGRVIFLDAYSEKAPDLKIDIMNPHYDEYYNGNNPPADYLTPKPIKFIVVKSGVNFIFRLLIDKNLDKEIIEEAKKSIEKALFEEGIGAKTALGYGLFYKPGEDKNVNNTTKTNKQLNNINNNISKTNNQLGIGSKVKVKFKEIKNGYINVIITENNEKGSFIKNQISDNILKRLQQGEEIEVTIKGKTGYGWTFEKP